MKEENWKTNGDFLHALNNIFQKQEFKHVTVQLISTYRWFKHKTHIVTLVGKRRKRRKKNRAIVLSYAAPCWRCADINRFLEVHKRRSN